MELLSQANLCHIQRNPKYEQTTALQVGEVHRSTEAGQEPKDNEQARKLSGLVQWDDSVSNLDTVKVYAFGDKEVTVEFPKLVHPEDYSKDNGF